MKSGNIYLAAAMVILFSSCEKVINIEPDYQLDGNERFETIDDYELALTGAYRLFRSNSYYGATNGSNAFVCLTDMISDNVNETGESLGNYTSLINWTYAEDEPNIDDTWEDAYGIIAQANLTLRDIDKLSATSAGAVNRIKAQALAIRAMVHFDILRYWAEEYDRNSAKPGIPYITVFDYEQKPSRGTVKAVYDQLEKDLRDAENLMASMDRAINDASRAYMDVNAINALRARMFLYSNQLDSAIKYSSLVINAFPLASRTQFPLVWQDASAAEVIWSVVFNSGEGAIGDNVYFAVRNRSSFRPNQTLVASYDQANDIRFTSYYRTISNRRVLSKYIAKQAASTKPDGVVNFKVFRTAEMYLIRAEAYARKGGADEVLGLNDLNTLRAVRISGYLPVVLSGSALTTAIATERRKELICEGHRWFDLKRTTRTVNRANCTDFCTLPSNDRSWAWPIPLTEINANANILPQNPGY
ncbi:MAG: RagB/SusD family nutrient uptake outer membrane protein [Chitinophagaceae bacterium]|nr:RagB/SusD family nutrient uptake outer membrane protein [Chitinophagaceae bacterium]